MGIEEYSHGAEKEKANTANEEFKGSSFGYRHQQCLVLFFSLTTAYCIRATIGVALVGMTESLTDLNNTSITSNITSDISATGNKTESILHHLLLAPPYPTFRWNKRIQDTIQSSFFWGYMLLQIPAGQLVHRYGIKHLISIAMIINGVSSICMPWAAYYGGWVCILLCRFTQGLSQACLVPSIHKFMGKWAPVTERGRMAALTYGGQALGPVIGMPLTGLVASTGLGWPGIFRVYGVLAGLVSVMIWFTIYESPNEHPKISVAERQHIEEGIGNKQGTKKNLSVPWGKILSTPGMYAIIAAHVGQTWVLLLVFAEVPSYLADVIGVDIKANGILSALPFLVMWFSNFFFSWLTDMFIVKNILSLTHTRKLANSLSCFPVALAFIALAYAPRNLYIVEAILIIICSFKVASFSGFQVNHVDISPNFAGTMVSISNFCSNAVGSLAPLVTGLILGDNVTDVSLWRIVFFVSAAVPFTSNLVYLALGTAERADWDEPDHIGLDNIAVDSILEEEAMIKKPIAEEKL